MSSNLTSSFDTANQENKEYNRLSLGVDIGTSHCEVIAYGKNYDEQDEEKYHYSDHPISVRCISSLILLAKDNESSMNYILKFQKTHQIPLQQEYLNGVNVPYIYFDQVEELLRDQKMTKEELDVLRRSTTTHYPIKTKKEGTVYSELEIAVIRLNIELSLTPYVQMGLPLDIAFAKPCEAGKDYDKILQGIASSVTNQNGSNDNRFMIHSEAVFTGHYLINMLEGMQQTISVCDIGAGTGDVYIFDQDDSKTKAMKTFSFAGNQVTLELMKKLKEYCNVDISERDANLLKEKHGYIAGYHAPSTIRPVLADLYIQGRPRKVRSGKSLDAGARPMAHDAVNAIVQVFKEYHGCHPSSLALTGYQGQLDGLGKAIEEGLRLAGYEVKVLNLKAFGETDPRSIVGKGAENYSRSLKNEDWMIL